MATLLLSIHVVLSIVFVGPAAVAVSIFPRFVPATVDVASRPQRAGERNVAAARVIYRITRVYGLLAVAVPVIGIALAVAQQRMTETWVLVAMALTALAGALLALRIVPLQRHALERNATSSDLRSMHMLGGVFNLLWVAVVVLMIVRPGAVH